MKQSRLILVCLLLVSAWGCQKKQDLVQKAFADKDFDRRLERKEQEKIETKEEEPEVEDPETKVDVLLDNLNKPKEGESVFMGTGVIEREGDVLFANDPEAPVLNFEEAKIYDIIHALCQVLQVNYIIDPSVKDQTVTIGMVEGDQAMKTSELFDLVLKLHDLTMVVRDNFIYILPIESREVFPGLEMLYGTKGNPNLRREELVIQMIPLKYVSAQAMSDLIKDFLSSSAKLLQEPKNNILIIIDKAQYIHKVMDLIPTFDVDILANKKMIFYELAHVDAVEVAGRLQEVLQIYGFENDGEGLGVVAIETLNGILVVSRREDVFDEIDYWIKKFDQEAQFEEDQVFIYEVEHTTAYSLAGTVSQLFGLQSRFSGGTGGNRGGSAISRRRTTSPTGDPQDENNRTNTQQQDPNNLRARQNEQSVGEGPLMIVDEDNNSLIFQTTPRDYLRIRKTLRQLDVLPRQIFLEVTVLSVDLKDTYSLGLQWSANNNAATSTSEAVSGGWQTGESGGSPTFSTVYSYTGLTSSIQATISAAKNKGYANVLQQPHIMAIDNKSAAISIGTEVPIATTTTNLNNVANGNVVNPASSSTIQYRPTGVNLSFTPHINANGVIRLEIELDISEAGAQSSSAEAVPISQNTLSTEMIVRDSQTVVMGGLIFDQESWGKDSVPFLEKIPLIRHLFTSRNSSTTKRELIVMITPRLVDSEEKSIEISNEFKEKILKEFKGFKR